MFIKLEISKTSWNILYLTVLNFHENKDFYFWKKIIYNATYVSLKKKFQVRYFYGKSNHRTCVFGFSWVSLRMFGFFLRMSRMYSCTSSCLPRNTGSCSVFFLNIINLADQVNFLGVHCTASDKEYSYIFPV